jgi:hypothetical protein
MVLTDCPVIYRIERKIIITLIVINILHVSFFSSDLISLMEGETNVSPLLKPIIPLYLPIQQLQSCVA